MNIENLNELPDWDDDAFGNEDGESWKPNPTRDACKAMYVQWNTVMIVLKAAFESMKEPADDDLMNKEMVQDQVDMVMGDAFQVAVKIKSSEAGMYILRMENAAIIRKHAQYIKISTNGFMAQGLMEEEHRRIVREEIDRFRKLFKIWIATFEKDEFEDEWGLFI